MNKLVLSLTLASLVFGGTFVSSAAIAQVENSAPVVEEAAPAAAPAAATPAKAKKAHAKKAHKAKKHHAKKHHAKKAATAHTN